MKSGRRVKELNTSELYELYLYNEDFRDTIDTIAYQDSVNAKSSIEKLLSSERACLFSRVNGKESFTVREKGLLIGNLKKLTCSYLSMYLEHNDILAIKNLDECTSTRQLEKITTHITNHIITKSGSQRSFDRGVDLFKQDPREWYVDRNGIVSAHVETVVRPSLFN